MYRKGEELTDSPPPKPLQYTAEKGLLATPIDNKYLQQMTPSLRGGSPVPLVYSPTPKQ